MKNPTSLLILLFSILSAAACSGGAVSEGPKEVENWFKTLRREKPPEKMTKLHFYFHDLTQGRVITSAEVARANMTAASPTFFGSVSVADDPLTIGPEFRSKRVGYAKGFYGAASFEEVGLILAMTFVFTDGAHNGSSLSVLGHNPDRRAYRELPVVGGSGLFRLARGIAALQTYFFDPAAGNATVEVDMMVLHY